MTADQQPYPVVRVRLGDPLEHVREQSTYRFGFENFGDDDPRAITEPVVFEYTHPERGFVLPPTRFVWLSVTAGHIVGVNTSPHLEYLSLDEAIELCRGLIEQFDNAGWERAADVEYPSLEERREQFRNPETRTRQEVGIVMWRSGGDKLYITMQRKWKADQSLPQYSGQQHDFFVVNVFIENRSIRRKYRREAEARRSEGAPE